MDRSPQRRRPNLTEIAKRNKGTYPGEMVYCLIDGRQKVTGHGGPDMPESNARTRTGSRP